LQLQNAHSALLALTKEKDRVIELKVLMFLSLSTFPLFVLEILIPSSELTYYCSGARNRRTQGKNGGHGRRIR